MKKVFLAFVCILFLNACDLLSNPGGGVSEEDTVNGLKSALNIGVNTAVDVLGVQDGFFKNEALKILLPAEVSDAISKIEKVPVLGNGITKLAEDLVLALNRSAEDAVKTATPIFVSAITGMTITDGVNILFGSNNAATAYLHDKTYTQLSDNFSPKVSASLDKDLVAGFSANTIWTNFSTQYNNVANSMGSILDIKPVNVNLGQYVTEKALDGLFSKVADEEKNIRTNPGARVNDLLQRVFGQLD